MRIPWILLVALLGCGSRRWGLDDRPSASTCVAPRRPATRVRLDRAFAALQLAQPVSLVASRDQAAWYAAERGGRVWRFAVSGDGADAELVLDLSQIVDASHDATGLLAIAVHPRRDELFVSYMASGGVSRVARHRSQDGGRHFGARGDVVLSIEQANDYHLNADLHFGPDGDLYIGFGDGGPQGDPEHHAQNRYSLKGKILRLDVDARGPYAIPRDNPFAIGGGAPEVWAFGLRNPWRFTFDRKTGELWAGDVGWDREEEIDRIVRGGNYGWSVREGAACVTAGCSSAGLIDPVVSLPHPEVASVTMGFVYRGSQLPGLAGHLVYGDFGSGFLWEIDPGDRAPEPHVINGDGHAVVTFAEAGDGEQYVVDYDGTIWRLAPGAAGPADLATLLSSTGCFDRDGDPASGLIPYDIAVPFWSDGAGKRRWFAIPDGTTIGVADDGGLDLPIGSVIAKEFRVDDVRVETRLLVRHEDGDWAGYTYRWNASQNDAVLVPQISAPTLASWSGHTWYYPRRGECLRCHRASVGRTLGLELAQLDRMVEYPNGPVADQLETLERLGMFARPLPRERQTLRSSSDSVEGRARTWLHVNCAFCHRGEGAGMGDMDLRFTTRLEGMHVCGVVPAFGTLGVANARLVSPGAPERSLLALRIHAPIPARMPPLGAFDYDRDGLALVEAWIRQLRCCDGGTCDPD